MSYSLRSALVVFALGVSLAACSSSKSSTVPAEPPPAAVPASQPATAPSAAEEAPNVFDAAPPVGAKASCPVSHEVFTVAADSERFEHAGKHYVFCCAKCKQKLVTQLSGAN